MLYATDTYQGRRSLSPHFQPLLFAVQQPALPKLTFEPKSHSFTPYGTLEAFEKLKKKRPVTPTRLLTIRIVRIFFEFSECRRSSTPLDLFKSYRGLSPAAIICYRHSKSIKTVQFEDLVLSSRPMHKFNKINLRRHIRRWRKSRKY